MKTEIYDRTELDTVIDEYMPESYGRLVKAYIDRQENRIKWVVKRARMACELVGDNVVDEALMYQGIEDEN